MSDDEKKAWQEQQAALDVAQSAQRDKDEKARARKARKAKRRLERLKRELSKSGDLTDWEDEFTSSVTQRLTQYDSAFSDLEKGGRGDALSYGQKAIVSQLTKKAKKANETPNLESDPESGPESDSYDPDAPQKTTFKPRSSFKSKKSKFTPRVRQLDGSFDDEPAPLPAKLKPLRSAPKEPAPPPVGKPFLRIVKNDN